MNFKSALKAAAHRACEGGSWTNRWIGLDTAGHPKLALMVRAAEDFCRGLIDDPRSGRLLVLVGPTGTGKTHVMRRIVRWAKFVGPSTQYVEREGVVRNIIAEFYHWPNTVSEAKESQSWGIFRTMADATLLALDEVGGEHDPSRVAVEKLRTILSKRERRWTIITTNLASLEDWERTYDVRVASRFLRNSTIIDTTGVPDYGLR